MGHLDLAPMVFALGLTLSAGLGCDRPPTAAAVDAGPDPCAPLPYDPTKATPPPPQDTRVVSVATGNDTSCAVLHDGTVWCWGSDDGGELGWYHPLMLHAAYRRQPTKVAGVSGARAVAVGDSRGCAVIDDASVRCWGKRRHPRHCDNRVLATAIVGVTEVEQLAMHLHVTCARRRDGTVWCWRGAMGEVTPPAAVNGLTDVTGLWLQHRRADKPKGCIRRRDKSLECGRIPGPEEARAGELFVDLEAVDVGPVVGVTFGHQRGCAVTSDGGVRCWRHKEGTWAFEGPPPEWLATIDDIEQAVLWYDKLCVRRRGGEVRCGRLDQAEHTVPATGMVQIAGGGEHNCGLSREGIVRCWGQNGDGQLGDGTRIQRQKAAPVRWR